MGRWPRAIKLEPGRSEVRELHFQGSRIGLKLSSASKVTIPSVSSSELERVPARKRLWPRTVSMLLPSCLRTCDLDLWALWQGMVPFLGSFVVQSLPQDILHCAGEVQTLPSEPIVWALPVPNCVLGCLSPTLPWGLDHSWGAQQTPLKRSIVFWMAHGNPVF
jgi:hypothetical protein